MGFGDADWRERFHWCHKTPHRAGLWSLHFTLNSQINYSSKTLISGAQQLVKLGTT